MQAGEVIVMKVVEDALPVPTGPIHADLTKAKVWARRAGFPAGDKIAFFELRAEATIKPRLVDLDFGVGGDPAPEEPVPVAEQA